MGAITKGGGCSAAAATAAADTTEKYDAGIQYRIQQLIVAIIIVIQHVSYHGHDYMEMNINTVYTKNMIEKKNKYVVYQARQYLNIIKQEYYFWFRYNFRCITIRKFFNSPFFNMIGVCQDPTRQFESSVVDIRSPQFLTMMISSRREPN